MEYANHLNEYAPAPSEAQVAEEVAQLKVAAKANENIDVYKFCYSTIDLTTLSCNDSVESVTRFAERAVEFYNAYPEIPNVASICVYPSFVETVGLAVDGSPMRITSVAGGFPASQTFLEVKMLEVAMAVENGADEWGEPLMILPPAEVVPITVEVLADPEDWQLKKLENGFLKEIGEEPATEEKQEQLAQAIRDDKITFFVAKRGYRAVGMCSVSKCFSTFACTDTGVFDDSCRCNHQRQAKSPIISKSG